MDSGKQNINQLHGFAQFAMFVSSYLPLFLLIVIRQLSENSEYLHWSGFNWKGIYCFASKFGLSLVLTIVVLFGWYGYRKTLRNIEGLSKNGFTATVKDVNNKNSESIGYIATYLIPFLFQSFNSWFECFSVLFLLVIIYRIYINSSLLLINPVLSIWYSIFEIEFEEGNKQRKGLVITKHKFLQEEESVKLYEIGHKLYFLTLNKFKK